MRYVGCARGMGLMTDTLREMPACAFSCILFPVQQDQHVRMVGIWSTAAASTTQQQEEEEQVGQHAGNPPKRARVDAGIQRMDVGVGEGVGTGSGRGVGRGGVRQRVEAFLKQHGGGGGGGHDMEDDCSGSSEEEEEEGSSSSSMSSQCDNNSGDNNRNGTSDNNNNNNNNNNENRNKKNATITPGVSQATLCGVVVRFKDLCQTVAVAACRIEIDIQAIQTMVASLMHDTQARCVFVYVCACLYCTYVLFISVLYICTLLTIILLHYHCNTHTHTHTLPLQHTHRELCCVHMTTHALWHTSAYQHMLHQAAVPHYVIPADAQPVMHTQNTQAIMNNNNAPLNSYPPLNNIAPSQWVSRIDQHVRTPQHLHAPQYAKGYWPIESVGCCAARSTLTRLSCIDESIYGAAWVVAMRESIYGGAVGVAEHEEEEQEKQTGKELQQQQGEEQQQQQKEKKQQEEAEGGSVNGSIAWSKLGLLQALTLEPGQTMRVEGGQWWDMHAGVWWCAYFFVAQIRCMLMVNTWSTQMLQWCWEWIMKVHVPCTNNTKMKRKKMMKKRKKKKRMVLMKPNPKRTTRKHSSSIYKKHADTCMHGGRITTPIHIHIVMCYQDHSTSHAHHQVGHHRHPHPDHHPPIHMQLLCYDSACCTILPIVQQYNQLYNPHMVHPPLHFMLRNHPYHHPTHSRAPSHMPPHRHCFTQHCMMGRWCFWGLAVLSLLSIEGRVVFLCGMCESVSVSVYQQLLRLYCGIACTDRHIHTHTNIHIHTKYANIHTKDANIHTRLQGRVMLLDCGEGCWGALLRQYGPQRAQHIVSSLELVWISHRCGCLCVCVCVFVGEFVCLCVRERVGERVGVVLFCAVSRACCVKLHHSYVIYKHHHIITYTHHHTTTSPSPHTTDMPIMHWASFPSSHTVLPTPTHYPQHPQHPHPHLHQQHHLHSRWWVPTVCFAGWVMYVHHTHTWGCTWRHITAGCLRLVLLMHTCAIYMVCGVVLLLCCCWWWCMYM